MKPIKSAIMLYDIKEDTHEKTFKDFYKKHKGKYNFIWSHSKIDIFDFLIKEELPAIRSIHTQYKHDGIIFKLFYNGEVIKMYGSFYTIENLIIKLKEESLKEK